MKSYPEYTIFKSIVPILSELKSWVRYHKIIFGSNGAILKKMKHTKSIFIHVPKTGGKSVLEAIYGVKLHEGFGHAGSDFYRAIFGLRQYNQYYKFAFVRNPWDRAFSGYNFARQGGFGFHEDSILEDEFKFLTFESFVIKWLPRQNLDDWTIFRPQCKFICDTADNLMVDRVCYFEDMKDEYSYLSHRFHVNVDLPHVNKSHPLSSYQESYNKEMREIIQKIYSKDIAMFGYFFEGHLGS